MQGKALFKTVAACKKSESSYDPCYDSKEAITFTPCLLNSPQFWGNQIPSHWESGCLFTWQSKGKHPTRSQCGQEIIVELMTDISANRLFLDLGANDGLMAPLHFCLRKIDGREWL